MSRNRNRHDDGVDGRIGFFGVLTILFITLKLTDIITWSWWWVLAPTWIPIATIIILFVAYLVLKKEKCDE